MINSSSKPGTPSTVVAVIRFVVPASVSCKWLCFFLLFSVRQLRKLHGTGKVTREEREKNAKFDSDNEQSF